MCVLGGWLCRGGVCVLFQGGYVHLNGVGAPGGGGIGEGGVHWVQ